MRIVITIILLATSCLTPPPAFSTVAVKYELNYPSLFILQWTYDCSQAMQPQFQSRGMPRELALRFSIQNCTCVIDQFRRHYRYEEVVTMDEEKKFSAAEKMTQKCSIGINKNGST